MVFFAVPFPGLDAFLGIVLHLDDNVVDDPDGEALQQQRQAPEENRGQDEPKEIASALVVQDVERLVIQWFVPGGV